MHVQDKGFSIQQALSSVTAAGATGPTGPGELAAIIPANTRVDSYIALNKDTLACDLMLQTNNETVIKASDSARLLHAACKTNIKDLAMMPC